MDEGTHNESLTGNDPKFILWAMGLSLLFYGMITTVHFKLVEASLKKRKHSPHDIPIDKSDSHLNLSKKELKFMILRINQAEEATLYAELKTELKERFTTDKAIWIRLALALVTPLYAASFVLQEVYFPKDKGIARTALISKEKFAAQVAGPSFPRAFLLSSGDSKFCAGKSLNVEICNPNSNTKFSLFNKNSKFITIAIGSNADRCLSTEKIRDRYKLKIAPCGHSLEQNFVPVLVDGKEFALQMIGNRSQCLELKDKNLVITNCTKNPGQHLKFVDLNKHM
ncbi:MAG: hypothetical protein H7249_05780 [Chitinophagaceae bacterium]|nr:hypothetical protein [Oligoflexus sp.]